MELIVAVVSVAVAVAIGLPALLYQRRQTRLAEEGRSLAAPVVQVDRLQRMRSEMRLRVGYLHYPPFTVAPSADDEPPTGLYVDLITKLCESEGVLPAFEQVRFSSAIAMIQQDRVDVVLSIFQTPRRARSVDFAAFLHSVSVSGVTRRQEDRVTSQADLVALPLKFVVCREEIGHEILEDQLKIPVGQMTIIDTSNIADIIEMVAAKKADVAIADGLSCQHGLAARGAEGPKLKPILRRRPLYLCPNGVMVAKGQNALAEWLDRGIKRLRDEPQFRKAEDAALEEFHGIINRM